MELPDRAAEGAIRLLTLIRMTPPTPATVFATSLAALCWLGVYAEGIISFQRSLAVGYGFGHAAFLFLRFFTNLTVIFVGTVMSLTAWRAWRREPLLSPAVHAATVVYILVVSMTYEVPLRRLWSPHGIWFVRDALMHDVIPALGIYPRGGVRRPASSTVGGGTTMACSA